MLLAVLVFQHCAAALCFGDSAGDEACPVLGSALLQQKSVHKVTALVEEDKTVDEKQPISNRKEEPPANKKKDGLLEEGRIGAPAHSVPKSFVAQAPADCVGTYEAEHALFSGASIDGTWHCGGCTGDGFVDYTEDNGAYIEWSVSSCAGGTYQATFGYSLWDSAGGALQVLVNGASQADSFTFPTTGGWRTWGEVSLDVTLSTGSNVIRLATIGGGGPNVDFLTLSEARQTGYTNLGDGMCVLENGVPPEMGTELAETPVECAAVCLADDWCSGYTHDAASGTCLVYWGGPLHASGIDATEGFQCFQKDAWRPHLLEHESAHKRTALATMDKKRRSATGR